MNPSNNIVGPIPWADWYVMKQLYLSLKDAKTDSNGLTIQQRYLAYTHIKKQYCE